ncbi:MAG: bis(5'-nucleosyl)-tetraphosphatase (symmetrical) YqeK [Parasporobacterium sp.]|nr:bis(5'-nucleosyl)-tetraphosphatase (symmetrical) YqeK [Parasporobacterium sp.]
MKFELVGMLEGQLNANLDEKRFLHTRGVAYTAAALAMRWYKYEIDRVMIAGYMHDCAKCMSLPQQLRAAEDGMIYLSDYYLQHPKLIHALVGPAVAQEEYGIFDREIHDAIRTHTTGAPDMSVMQKIIYVADFIEPNREGIIMKIENIRETAFTDLDKAVYMIADRTLEYLKKQGADIDPLTEKTRDFYKKLIEEREGVE